MTPERWQSVNELYHEAHAHVPQERVAFLREQCAGDDELYLEVTSLLEAHEKADEYLSTPALEVEARAIASEPVTALPLRQLAHYEILSLLGVGGMGEVWLASDTRLGRKVALKILPGQFTSDIARVRRFEQEAKATSALNHPNIVTIHEIGEVENIHYIVTEYVAGETLRQRMMAAPQQQMRASEALDFAVQIAAALAAAHEAGIIHRDIKSENVMVRRDGIIKVLDFGLAKLNEMRNADFGLRNEDDATLVQSGHDDPQSEIHIPQSEHPHSTLPGIVMGTPRYMSPEQARGESVDARTDLFSLGVMLYEMIAGCAPFTGATANKTIAAILRDEPLPLIHHVPAAPAALERIVSQALRKERTDRYQTAEALRNDLKELKQQIDLEMKLSETDFLVPLQSAPTKVVTTNKDLIVLADFENNTDDPVFDVTLKQGLAIQLRQSPFLSLFPEERVRHTLRLMKLSPEARVTTKIALEICLRDNLKALIAGSIAPLGSHYVITLEAIDGQTGWTLETEQAEARKKEHVLRALSQAASRLRAKLGESLSSIQLFDKEMEETTTEKLEAFQAYSLGYEQTLSGRLVDAIQLYRRAVELDPDFSYAWSMLSIHNSVFGRPGLAAEYAEKAYALKERVSDYEQLQVTFRYHYNFTGDLYKALDAATLFKRIYPRTSTAPIDLLVAYDLLGQHDLAVAEGHDAIHLNPNFAPAYFYLGRSLLRVNRFAEAKDISRQALVQKFDLTNIHAVLYFIACAEGDTQSRQQQIEWTRGRPDEFVALDWQAGAAACAGQWREAQEFARHAIDLAAHGNTQELAARYAVEQALRGVVLEDYPQAKADAAHGLQLARGRASLPRAALALALCGEAHQVTPLINELRQCYPDDTMIHSIWLPTIRAALELQRGNAAQAIDYLQTTTSYEAAAEFWPQSLRGKAYLKLRCGTEAAAEFQKILAHRGHAPLSPLYPLAHLGLARAAALTNDLARSRKAYEDFFVLWKEADADLPMLATARKEFK